MISVYVYNIHGEWVFWCQCKRRNLCQLQELARAAGIECDWLGW